ncbi:hypothetical protein P5673_032343 [Acropora cervicornis]|uniref:Uncharacterized protein n=1 Tax=Acropora cervicornis TaxID=6130 RepID=A0AAD9PRE3_ACRCE|nr:hypothetical protein P5673_032343 [Acropora cervicornis]
MSRKYYNRLNSLLRREEAARKKMIVEEPRTQRKWIRERTTDPEVGVQVQRSKKEILEYNVKCVVEGLGRGYKNASVQFRNTDRGLLEQPKDESGKEHKVHLGSVVFGCCSKMLL